MFQTAKEGQIFTKQATANRENTRTNEGDKKASVDLILTQNDLNPIIINNSEDIGTYESDVKAVKKRSFVQSVICRCMSM